MGVYRERYGTCYGCGGSGRKALMCTRCGGSGTFHASCHACHGTGHRVASDAPCENCGGSGVWTAPCRHCGGEGRCEHNCVRCGGTGQFDKGPRRSNERVGPGRALVETPALALEVFFGHMPKDLSWSGKLAWGLMGIMKYILFMVLTVAWYVGLVMFVIWFLFS